MISIILPVYNSDLYIKDCLKSILNQTYKNFEIIIIDDGSTDKSYEICSYFYSQDNRIKLFYQKNSGPGIARNVALKHFKGDYIFFIDADDYISPNTLESLLNISIKYNCDIVQCGICYVYENYGLIKRNRQGFTILNRHNAIKELIKQKNIKNFVWGKLYKTSVIKEIYFPEQRFFEDFYWMERAIHNSNKYGIIEDPLYFYRQHYQSLSNNIPNHSINYNKVLEERLFFIQKYYPSFLPLIKKQIYSFRECNSCLNIILRWLYRVKNRIFYPYEKIKIKY